MSRGRPISSPITIFNLTIPSLETQTLGHPPKSIMSSSSDDENPYYTFYKPSVAAAAVVAILFCLCALVQIWRIIVTRQWFGIVVLVAAACMSPCSPRCEMK